MAMIAFTLGGVGTGSISLGGRGQLRDWEIFNRPDKGRTPEYAFASLWVKPGGEAAQVRSLLRLLLETGLRNVAVRTFVIERAQPLSAADEAYLLEGIFRGTWGGERLRPYLSSEDHAELARLCDPQSDAFALSSR